MIPILYDKTETVFTSNGLGRLRDCISCVVTEERNGIYECDFEYPVNGANYDLIQVGRIIGVTHDESGDIQPFDIVSFEKPIDGVVTFHCTHISYRMSYLTIRSGAIAQNSLADAFDWIANNSKPACPFTFWTDKTSTGYCASLQTVPYSVRQVLGGVEGSILDAYGGEYEWDKWTVKLWSARGQYRDFSIRYGVNMLEYNEEVDSSDCYSSVRPYWTDGTTTVVGDKQDSGATPPSGRDQCVPLDVSDKFESQPTKAQVEAMGLSVMNSVNATAPRQTIDVSFVRLQDMGEYADCQNLLQCKLCDTINVIFPDFNSSGQFKIVQTEWNVLTGKYESMQLGTLATTLAEALGVDVESRTSYSGGGGGGSSNYNDLSNKPQINSVTLSGNKTLLDLGINIPTITDTYSGTSSDGMSGKAVKSAIDALDGTVSGSAGSGKTLTAFSQTDGKVSATFGNISITKSQVSDFPTLATVATSGDYDDLIDKPTIPTVNNATLTIQKNSTNVATFTANASTDVTADISVPTNTNELTNGAGFITSPDVVYCTCSTAAGTAAKEATIVSGTLTTLTTGCQAIVKFTNANGVASPTLKVGNTDAKAIRRYGTTAPSTSAATSWNAGSCVLFVYDGTYWYIANYLNSTYSEISSANITNGTGSTTGLVTGRRAKAAVEAFAPSATTTTPKMDGTAAVGSETTWAKGDHVHPSDTNKQDKLVSGTNIKTINNSSILGSGNLTIGGGGGGVENIVDGSAIGSLRSVDSATEDASYTIGTDAFAVGYNTKASGANSHAEGNATTASASNAHAEGFATIASGSGSHAEGFSSDATGDYSHAEGGSTEASGDYSHSSGHHTTAQRKSQFVCGEYNELDTTGADGTVRGDYAFIVGNGTSSGSKSNALTVAWDGKLSTCDYSGTLKTIYDLFYPVGSYYETSDTSFDPNTAWGGVWVLELAGMVHVSGGTGYPVSNADSASGVGVKDGGASTVTLDTTQIPAHTHGNKELKGYLQIRRVGTTANSGYIANASDGIMSGSTASGQSSMPNLATSSASSTTLARYHVDASHTHGSVGGGQSHENMPPYINVNRWHRTA